MDGASLYDLLKFFIFKTGEARMNERTAAVTYNFLMAMPSTFLFLLSMVPYLPYLPLKNVQQTILSTLKIITPNTKMYYNIAGVVGDFMNKPHKNAMSFGILMVLYFSSNGMVGLMKGFDRNLTLYKKRNAYQRRWTAVKLTLFLIFFSIVTLIVLVLQNKTLNHLILSIIPDNTALKVVSSIILVPMMFLTPGSIFATVASVISTSGFLFMVNNFLNYNKIYGSVGTLIAFMALIWLNTYIILLGFELNVNLLLGKIKTERRQYAD
jgi:membrane protein